MNLISIYSYNLCVVIKTGKEFVQIPIRELSKKEYIEFKNASNSLYKIDRKLMFLRIVYWNYNTLKQCEIDYNKYIRENSFYFDDDHLFDIIRHIHNYLSSVHMCVEQYKANVSREYSEIVDEFNEHRKDLYSENISYRLIWEFRNELQHSKMPDINVKFLKNSAGYFEMKIYIKKDYLLNIKKLKKDSDIKQLEDKVDLFEHCNKMNKCLDELAQDVFLKELEEVYNDYIFLKKLLEEIHIEGEPIVEKSYNGIKPEYTLFNTRLVDTIGKLIEYNEK